MTRIASIDGVLSQPDEAKVSVYDRGFLYGDSVFETIRTYAGEPFALDEHMARLARSAAKVGIAMPIPPADFGMEVRRAVRAARNPESSARIMLTRGSGPPGLDPALATAPLRVVLVEPLTPPPAALYRDGVAVVTVRTERAADAAQGAKVGNYLASMLALKEAKSRGAHEALILDTSGHVVEGTTSNVFVVRGGEIYHAARAGQHPPGHHPRAPPRGRRRARAAPSTSRRSRRPTSPLPTRFSSAPACARSSPSSASTTAPSPAAAPGPSPARSTPPSAPASASAASPCPGTSEARKTPATCACALCQPVPPRLWGRLLDRRAVPLSYFARISCLPRDT